MRVNIHQHNFAMKEISACIQINCPTFAFPQLILHKYVISKETAVTVHAGVYVCTRMYGHFIFNHSNFTPTSAYP